MGTSGSKENKEEENVTTKEEIIIADEDEEADEIDALDINLKEEDMSRTPATKKRDRLEEYKKSWKRRRIDICTHCPLQKNIKNYKHFPTKCSSTN